MTAAYVVTGYSMESLQSENLAGTTELVDAKKLAVEHLEMLNQTVPGHDVVMFVEEWHGGEFRAHRQLRPDPENPGDAAYYQWFIAQGPTFAPTKEKTS